MHISTILILFGASTIMVNAELLQPQPRLQVRGEGDAAVHPLLRVRGEKGKDDKVVSNPVIAAQLKLAGVNANEILGADFHNR